MSSRKISIRRSDPAEVRKMQSSQSCDKAMLGNRPGRSSVWLQYVCEQESGL